MSKKNKLQAVETSIVAFAASAAEIYQDIVESKLLDRADVVLTDFARKDDERLQQIAKFNNEVAELEAKLAKAEKVSNQAALTRDIVITKAYITEINTLRANAAVKREAFITKFDTDAYAALADSTLVRDELTSKIAKVA